MELGKRRFDDLRWKELGNKRMREDDAELEVGLLIMNNDVGQVIGKGGEKIKSIRKESGARVTIKSLIPNSSERIGDVKGDVEEVSQAVQMIASFICEERPTITLLAESRNIGALIGKGGATINQIRNATQANVDIGRECLGDSTQKEIRITGDPDAASQAIDSIIKYLAEGKSQVRVPYEPYGGVALNRSSLGRHDRERGDRPLGYRQRFDRGEGFNMSPTFRNRRMWGEDGPGDNLRRNRSNTSRNQAPPSLLQIEKNVYVPKDMIGKIIGRSGCNINAIRGRSGATVEIAVADDDEPERKIIITGDRDSMDIACSMIEDLVRSF